MNTNFVLMDKNNNIQKNATAVVKFIFENKDYMIYSIPENEENSQVLASKIILNSEGKHFIEDISAEEKSKISNLVYNMVILIPTEAKKGSDKNELINNLKNKYSVNISIDIPELMNNDYFSNSSIAITNKILIEDAINFYKEALKEKEVVTENNTILTWTLPVEQNNSFEENKSLTSETINPSTNVIEEPKQENVEIGNTSVSDTNEIQPSINIPMSPVEEVQSQVISQIDLPTVAVNTNEEQKVNNVVPENISNASEVKVQPSISIPTTPVTEVHEANPQTEKLAIVSDPSINEAMGIKEANMQPNVMRKKAGFAINKYIIIGTACILLAVAVVIIAYILIQKKTTGV